MFLAVMVYDGVKTRFGGDGTYARKVPRSLVR